jgi:hypothetical protein
MYIEKLATCVVKANGKSGLVESKSNENLACGNQGPQNGQVRSAVHNPAPHYTTLHNPAPHNSACKQLGP